MEAKFDINIDSDELNNISENNKRCAPHLKFEDGSCITLDLLYEFAKVHNNNSDENKQIYLNKKIITNGIKKLQKQYKRYLVRELKKYYSNNQLEWKNTKIFSQMSKVYKDRLEDDTFRHEGPKGRFEWLNTLHIIEAMDQYENKYTDFKFLGAVPMDFNDYDRFEIRNIDYHKDLINKGKKRIGLIFNLDNHNESGSHWVALFANFNTCEIYYFDSYGEKPEKRVVDLMSKLKNVCLKYNTNVTIDYNKQRHQRENSECGIYSMNFILRLLRGDSFEEICDSRIPDRKINKCRLKYFNNTIQ